MTADTRKDLDGILATLRAHADQLRDRGIAHAAVFGSVARGEDGRDSDVDLLVTLDPGAEMDLFDFAGIAADLREWIGRPVDLAVRDRLKEHVRPAALRDAVDAF